MSEAQERYEYDPDYDEEPTEDAWTIRQDVFSRRYFVETADEIGTRVIADCSDEDRARLIAAAGTAAQEAREMGYDAQKALEALPTLLRKLEHALETLGVPASSEARINDTGQILEDALASAEGSDNE
jgi:hypothetical protein